jgi:FkbM family methyltransferase
MRLIHGWNLPDDDNYFEAFLATDPEGFQLDRLAQALSFCNNFRTAIDGGAHIGTWAVSMAASFERVYAFEPIRETFDCLVANIRERGCSNITTRESALSDVNGTASIGWDRRHQADGNTGSKYIRMNVNGSGALAVNRLDDLNIQDVDLLKLDIEGAELLALKGAEYMIKTCHPMVIVEVKQGYGARFGYLDDAVEKYLVSLGAREVLRMRADRVFIFD